jgi:hypothetical protein
MMQIRINWFQPNSFSHLPNVLKIDRKVLKGSQGSDSSCLTDAVFQGSPTELLIAPQFNQNFDLRLLAR